VGSQHNRNEWIDCLRGYSILIVIVSHFLHIDSLKAAFPTVTTMISGAIGVHIFYFISGYLVVGILNRDLVGRSNHQQFVTIRNFWMRRIFRLQPTLLLFLLAQYVFATQVNDALELWQLILPVSNWLEGPYVTWHLKTLHLEEAFYIFTPFLIIFGQISLKKKLLFLLLMFVLIRFADLAGRKMGFRVPEGFVLSYAIAFDPIIIGALVALQEEKVKQCFKGIFRQANPLLICAVSLTLIILTHYCREIVPFSYALNATWPTLTSILTIPLLLSGGTILQNKAARVAGLISYTLYLFQQLIFGPWIAMYGFFNKGAFIISALAFISFAPVWSYSVEQPLTRLGSRLFSRRDPALQTA
jgi:peptidoglycan/LPS O-acetylase OafA/YrhL